jgi:hypothetical protein
MTGRVYASVVRFKKPFGKDKFVAIKTNNKTMRAALRSLIRQIKTKETNDNA